MKKLFVALCVVGCAVASAFGWTVVKVSDAYQAKDESTGLVLNMAAVSSANHTIKFSNVRENPNSVTVLDFTGAFIEEDGTEWTLTQIGGSACTGGTAPIKSILTEVRLPETLEQIQGMAFMNCTNLTKVMPFLPASVKEIQNQAFYGSPVGGDLRLSNANLTTIGQNCFNCESGTVRGNLRSIDFTGSGVTEIGAYAFMNATNLTSVILPAMLTKIGGQAFFNCKSLTQVTPLLPDTLWSVGSKAFSGAKIKGDFTMRNRDAVSLPTSAFSGCQFSTIDLLRTSIATIGADAFAWNSELTKVVFPKTLSSLGENAFREATNLRQIYYANDFGVPPFSPPVFTVGLSAKFQRIYVPGGSQTWLKYLDEKGCALTDEEKDKFQEDYPGEKLPIGLVPYPRTITGTKLQYLCRWNPEPTGMTVLVR